MLGGALLAQSVFAATVIDLGGLAGGATQAAAINNHSQVTGSAFDANYVSHAFLYDNGTLTDLGFGQGRGINNNGVVVGSVSDPTGTSAAIFSGGNVTDLGASIGIPSFANGINDSGVSVGDVYGGNQAWDAFTHQQLSPTISSTTYRPSADGNGIDSAGDIVGTGRSTYFYHAFLYSGNTSTDLGSLDGYYSVATAINDNGVVVGGSQFDPMTTNYEAFVWTAQGGMVGLGTLDGTDSWARAVNSSGQIVGFSGYMAFLYSNGALIDLNSLLPANSGWILTDATGINDLGQIVGTGLHDGNAASYLLNLNGVASPEPRAWTLTVCGLGLLVVGKKFSRSDAAAGSTIR